MLGRRALSWGKALTRKEQRAMEKSMAKKTAFLGMMVSLAFVFSYLEALVPISIGIPGIKLGLANLVAIVTLYAIGVKEACAVSLIRILLTGFTFGSPASMAYSLAGGALSILAMIAARKINLFSAARSLSPNIFRVRSRFLPIALLFPGKALFLRTANKHGRKCSMFRTHYGR